MGTNKVKKKLFPVYNLYSIVLHQHHKIHWWCWYAFLGSFDKCVFSSIKISLVISSQHARLKIVFQTYWDSKYVFLLVCVFVTHTSTPNNDLVLIKKNLPLIFKNNRIQETSLLFYVFICDCEFKTQIKLVQWRRKSAGCRIDFFFKLASMLHTMWFASFFLPAHSLSECKEIQQYIAISASPKA